MTRILVVCTGNINRSALGAALLERNLGNIHTIRSAGVIADDMRSPDRMIEAAQEHGVDLSHHLSRLITPEDIEGAELVICMDRTHPVQLASVSETAIDKTFLLTELIDKLGSLPIPVPDLLTAVNQLAEERSPNEFLSPDYPDVPDPQGRSKKAFRQASEVIVDLINDVTPLLRR